MGTFIYDLAYSIEDRWSEIDILIEKASREENSDLAFYDALCRATVVLIVAHLEGFIKDVSRSIIQDINRSSTFKASPQPIKRVFCRSFVDLPSGENKTSAEHRIQRLMDMLDDLDTKFSVEPFLIENNHGNNKNPSPSIIERICTNFGVEGFFSWINSSRLDVVFSGMPSDVINLINELRDHLLARTELYPYTVDFSLFGIREAKNNKSGIRSFWETFLDQVLKNRHDVAIPSPKTDRERARLL